MADIQQLLDDEKKKVTQLEETIETKISQVGRSAISKTKKN